MGSSSSKFRKHLQAGDEVQALQLYRTNSELRKALDPNCSYGDSHQHETPLHLAAKHGMQTLLGIFLFSKGGNPKKTNARKETCLHCVCMETNSQSIHVGKRRADCLNYLLKWRGATLAEGQMEKLDLSAQDEKLNTALHYAASSGLSQCVEILIQHGAPLFIENEDNMTPCDTAEKSGHAGIALYLESKMVFSNDEESQEEEDNVSMPPVEEYSGLRPQDLQEAKDHLLVETADMLSVPLFTAEALLRNHEWSREMLLEAWMNDPVACCEKCGVIPPSTLFSDKPQVQENLASPLSSPLHATPSPQDAECKICSHTFLIVDEPVHMTCTHLFCKDCWERYLNVKIQEGDAHHITCPAYDCTMLVPIDIIERIVSRDMTLRYLQFDIKAFVDSNPDMKWCPYPSCGRAVKLPDLDLGSHHGIKRNKIPSDTSRGVDCGVGHYFCWECLEESHEPCSCENWNKWFQKINEVKPETLDGTEQETELAANCLWLVTNSKPCPNCKSPIQKNEGCNHMKCSKCKYDFCWVCLEQWKRHNSSTGGYFKCNRYEVLKKVEEQSAQLVSEAEIKSRNMQELNRFVHYYTRFKNHENSCKLEEPLLITVKDKMMKLAEAVTDNATAHAETKFVEDAVQQLLKARRVLKCSYVYGFYLDGPGYKKIVFEFMQTELEECTEVLSQMVNRLYLRTPRRKIMDQAHFVQRKRFEFIMAISKGLVPPETPPNVRKSKLKRKISGGEADDEDLHRAIVASIQEINPSNPWIKDASGRHTNVVALLEWPSDESEQSEEESEMRAARESIGKCHRSDCNKVRVKNPRTNEHHDYCSRWCMQVDKEDQRRKETEDITEIVLDEHMELLRALEMSRLQYLRDNGLLHVSDSQDTQQSSYDNITDTQAQSYRHRPRSNSADQETKIARKTFGLNSMKELGIELQRFHELSSAFPGGERDEINRESKRSLTKSKIHHCHKMSQSSRFDECGSTVVTRIPNKSVEDLYCLDQTATKSPVLDNCQSQDPLDETNGPFSACLLDSAGMITLSQDIITSDHSTDVKVTNLPPSESFLRDSDDHIPSFSSKEKSIELIGSMFGAIKDISVSNIHSNENDKTIDFLSKDLASIFASWDSQESRNMASSSCEAHVSTDTGYACSALTHKDSLPSTGKGSSGKSLSKSSCMETDSPVSRSVSDERLKSVIPYNADVSLTNYKPEEEPSWSWLSNSELGEHLVVDESISDEKLHFIDPLRAPEEFSGETLLIQEDFDGDFDENSLLEITENLLQITADACFQMKEAEKGIYGLDKTSNDSRDRSQNLNTMGSLVLATDVDLDKSSSNSDTFTVNDIGDSQPLYESIIDRNTGDIKQHQGKTPISNREIVSYQIPRTAWSIKENEEDTKWSSGTPKAHRKSSSQKTKVFDSDGACSQSPYKSLSESMEKTVAFKHDADGCVYKVPQNLQPGSEKATDIPCPGARQNVNRILEAITSNISLQQESQECETTESACSNILSSEDRSRTSLNSISSLDITTVQKSNTDMSRMVNQSSNVNSTKLDECTCSTPSVAASLTSDAMIKSAGVTPSLVTIAGEVEIAEKSDLSEKMCTYSLTRNISCDKLLHYSSYAAGESNRENEYNEEGTKIIQGVNDEEDNNAITTSAFLITNTCEVAMLDDKFEETSSVLPSDGQQSVNEDHICDDDDDLHSVYV